MEAPITNAKYLKLIHQVLGKHVYPPTLENIPWSNDLEGQLAFGFLESEFLLACGDAGKAGPLSSTHDHVSVSFCLQLPPAL